MKETKTKLALAKEAFMLAQGSALVRYRNVTYIPADYETLDTTVPPAPDRTIWLPMDRVQIQRRANEQFDTLFFSDHELSSFEYMLAQHANPMDKPVHTLLVRTPGGLKELNEHGLLEDVSGEFRPNTLVPMLNEDPDEMLRVFEVIEEWLDSEEEAHSLLHHLATCLAPGWSAVKYVLLLGEGRNGKSLLLKMLAAVLGQANVSNVTRQDIAKQSPVVTDLNGKLLNIVYDGLAEYLKDSGMEKSLVAGEQVSIRRLYESTPTPVQTTGLYIEGLQREPKTSDKSTALQKRLVRYQFPQVYPLDHMFERLMLSDASLGAFMALLLQHYVKERDVAVLLAPTAKGLSLQLDQMVTNSMGLQFLQYLDETDPLGVTSVLGSAMPTLAKQFVSWRVHQGDITPWSEPDVQALFMPLLSSERRSMRVDGQPRKVRVILGLKPEAAEFIKSLEGDDDGKSVQEVQGEGDERVREEDDGAV